MVRQIGSLASGMAVPKRVRLDAGAIWMAPGSEPSPTVNAIAAPSGDQTSGATTPGSFRWAARPY